MPDGDASSQGRSGLGPGAARKGPPAELRALRSWMVEPRVLLQDHEQPAAARMRGAGGRRRGTGADSERRKEGGRVIGSRDGWRGRLGPLRGGT
jgi:hypothetical protein